jgi:hypothetical protein
MNSSLDVIGASSLHSTLDVSGAATMNSSLDVIGYSRYFDNILATKDVTVQGNIYVRGNLAKVDAETIVLSDPLIVLGNSNMNGTYPDLGFQFIKDSNSNNYGYFGWVGLSNEFQFYETAQVDGNDLITSNSTLGTVRADTFIGSLEGSSSNLDHYISIDFCGNVFGDISFNGSESQLIVPLELESVNSNVGTFGNSVSVPTITVDTYGRVTAVGENSISTSLNLLDSNGDTGIVDLLNGNLRIDGTSRKIVSNVLDNVFSLSLPDNLLLVDISMTGMLEVDGASTMKSTLEVVDSATMNSSLDVVGASSLHSSLSVGGATTLESSLYVGELVNFNKDLIIQGNLTVHGTETKINVEILTIEDNKIELNSDGIIEPFGIYANISDHGGTISLFYETVSSRWEFNRDLYVSGNLTVTDSTTIQGDLLVENASTMNSSLDVVGNTTLENLFVNGSINNIIEISGNTIQPIISESVNLGSDESGSSNDKRFNLGFFNKIKSRTAVIIGNLTMENSSITKVDNITSNNNLNILGTNGVTINGNLNVNHTTRFNNTLYVSGNTILDSILEVDSSITSREYLVKDNVTGNSIVLAAPELSSGSYTLTLPSNDGHNKQILQTNGSGTLSWVTPDNSQQMFGNIITYGVFTTSNTAEQHLSPFDVSYTTSLSNSSVFLQYKVPYEASIQADQRISFIIKKFINNEAETTVQTDGNLGPRNATGGMRNIYISNLFETNTGNVGDNIVYKLYSKLESNVTAVDPLTGYARKAGVRFDTSGNYGSYMFKEFAN